jgi:hypothetical protein
MARPSLCAVHQPNFFPRLSTLAKLYTANTWVVLDDVQFAQRDYQHRARLATMHDINQQQWLSLSVHRSAGRATRLDQVRVVDRTRGRRRVELLLQQHYGRSPHWPAFRRELQAVLDLITATDRLIDITEASTLTLLKLVGWGGTVLRASRLGPVRSGRSPRLADLVAASGSEVYLCGTGGRRYLDVAPFAAGGIPVRWFAPQWSSEQEQAAARLSAVRAILTSGQEHVRGALEATRSLVPEPMPGCAKA